MKNKTSYLLLAVIVCIGIIATGCSASGSDTTMKVAEEKPTPAVIEVQSSEPIKVPVEEIVEPVIEEIPAETIEEAPLDDEDEDELWVD